MFSIGFVISAIFSFVRIQLKDSFLVEISMNFLFIESFTSMLQDFCVNVSFATKSLLVA